MYYLINGTTIFTASQGEAINITLTSPFFIPNDHIKPVQVFIIPTSIYAI